jgi:hypothetical protein
MRLLQTSGITQTRIALIKRVPIGASKLGTRNNNVELLPVQKYPTAAPRKRPRRIRIGDAFKCSLPPWPVL